MPRPRSERNSSAGGAHEYVRQTDGLAVRKLGAADRVAGQRAKSSGRMRILTAAEPGSVVFVPNRVTENIVPETNRVMRAMAGSQVKEVPSTAARTGDLTNWNEFRSRAHCQPLGQPADRPILRQGLIPRKEGRQKLFYDSRGNKTEELFKENTAAIALQVHDTVGRLDYDETNLEQIAGIPRSGDMGFDVVQLKKDKTFSTLNCGRESVWNFPEPPTLLARLMRDPRLIKHGVRHQLNFEYTQSRGASKVLYSNLGIIEGQGQYNSPAISNANYRPHLLRHKSPVSHIDRSCTHQFVLSALKQKKASSSAYEITKRLLDSGVSTPTIYWPAIVPLPSIGKPTETETPGTRWHFAEPLVRTDRGIQPDSHLDRPAANYLSVGLGR